MNHDKRIGKVQLKVEYRGRNVYVSSDDLPGLWLWGSDEEQVRRDVLLAVKKLYKYNNGIDVDVKEAHKTNFFRYLGLDKECDTYEIYRHVDQAERMVHG